MARASQSCRTAITRAKSLLIVVGDETKNRDLFEKALHVAFTKMGLEVADLDGVYIHFGKE